jgi:hypothetical protein
VGDTATLGGRESSPERITSSIWVGRGASDDQPCFSDFADLCLTFLFKDVLFFTLSFRPGFHEPHALEF